jgi:hypothetical protein
MIVHTSVEIRRSLREERSPSDGNEVRDLERYDVILERRG